MPASRSETRLACRARRVGLTNGLSREGIVVVAGMALGTVFTLLVIPAIYVLIAKEHAGERAAIPQKDEEVAAGELVAAK